MAMRMRDPPGRTIATIDGRPSAPHDEPSGRVPSCRNSASTMTAAHLLLDPRVGFFHPLTQRVRWLPAQGLAQELVVGAAPPHAQRPWNVPHPQLLAGDVH